MKQKNSNELTSLSNIGKAVAERLKEGGIETAGELKRIGSETAFIRLKTVDEGACINELMGLKALYKIFGNTIWMKVVSLN